jgi:hypothetical protein
VNHKRTIIVSLTTRMIVRNELLIFGGVGAAAGVCFFARRHGQLRELMDAAKAAVEESANKV